MYNIMHHNVSIIATCDAVFDNESEIYFKRLALHLSKKWNSSYSQMVGFIRARMQVCILRSASLCLRGSRTKWRGAGIEDSGREDEKKIPLAIDVSF
jgi:hypothetical protein